MGYNLQSNSWRVVGLILTGAEPPEPNFRSLGPRAVARRHPKEQLVLPTQSLPPRTVFWEGVQPKLRGGQGKKGGVWFGHLLGTGVLGRGAAEMTEGRFLFAGGGGL